MKYPSISIDTYDIVIVTALIGGFMTSNWFPFTLLIVFEMTVRWATKDE